MEAIVLTVIVLIVIAATSVFKDELNKSKMTKSLNSIGYNISESLDIPDIKNDNKPFCFMIDRENKKWFLLNYRQKDAVAFDYSDIADYKIIYRENAGKIVTGNEFSGSFSEFAGRRTKILDMIDLNKNNCENISFILTYQGKAQSLNLYSRFVLFEHQYDHVIDTQHHDYLLPSTCIQNANDFETLLFEIMCENTNQNREKSC